MKTSSLDYSANTMPLNARISTPDRNRLALQALFVAGLVAVLMTAPSLAFATNPFSSGATGLLTTIQSLLVPLCTIAVIFVGFMFFSGRMDKMTAGWAFFAIVVIFGAPSIVSWVRSYTAAV